MSVLYFDLNEFGAKPNSGEDAQPTATRLVEALNRLDSARPVTVRLHPGRYDFYPEHGFPWRGGLSNHSPGIAGPVAFLLQKRTGFTLEGNGAELRFHGLCFPFALQQVEGCRLGDFTIDFEERGPLQLRIDEIAADYQSLTVTPESGVAVLLRNGSLLSGGRHLPEAPFISFMTFEPNGRLAYRIDDRPFRPERVELLPDSRLRLTMPADELRIGQFLVLRPTARPNPALLFDRCRNVLLENVTLHYSPGIGVLAQASENLRLCNLQVCRRADGAERISTLHADATHFSGCKGVIAVESCRFEGMADDGINVHGTYLKVENAGRTGNSLCCRFAHEASSGFFWGEPGDRIAFLDTRTMRYLSGEYTIRQLRPIPGKDGLPQAFQLECEEPLPELPPHCGVENLTWTPEVEFQNNRVGNNRARGALFSTPRRILCEGNCFDHPHGAAILISGDCNGWFESGACHDVTIRNNRFDNPLTAVYEFCRAVITIEPVIPELEAGNFYHSNIQIIDNEFRYFDRPLLWATSVNGLTFRNNRIIRNREYLSFHPNQREIDCVACRNVKCDIESRQNQL